MIVYFSGTGNSRWCADLLADHLQDETLDSFGYIRNGIAADLISGKPWVFVCPTYAWKIPRIFEQFIRSGNFMGEQEAYFVLTCGAGVGGAGAFLEELCQNVGLRYMGILEVVLPENYIAMFPVPDETKSRKIFEKARPVLLEGVYHIKQKQPFPGSGGPPSEQADQRCVLQQVHQGRSLYRFRQMHRLRQMCGCLCARQRHAARRQAGLGTELYPLYGLHLRLPCRGHRIRPHVQRQAPLSGTEL